ncbi:hypothetical protein [Bacillus sp. JCM 19034]|uniref:hypothetical protein n=1 Tax=Bacillus sp. JCM 19034 TaxID=1481928 RepID=UPI0007838ACA|nr:hypothetical protein [Bacillus sp. JCM 19034]
MIDLEFKSYDECTLSNFELIDSYDVNHWTHYVIRFSGNIPKELIDPEALVIASSDQTILQIVLRDEGCDCHLFQFTETEKRQLEKWMEENVLLN